MLSMDTLELTDVDVLAEQTQPCFFDLPRQTVCDITPGSEAIFPPPVMRVKYNPARPNELRYLSWTLGQEEKDREWDGVIRLSDEGKEVLRLFLATHPEVGPQTAH